MIQHNMQTLKVRKTSFCHFVIFHVALGGVYIGGRSKFYISIYYIIIYIIFVRIYLIFVRIYRHGARDISRCQREIFRSSSA